MKIDAVRVHGDLIAARYALGPATAVDLSDDVFQTLAWFDNLQRHGIEAHYPVLAMQIGIQAERPGLILPLMLRPQGAAAVYGPVLASLSNYYSSLFGPSGQAEQCTTSACSAMLRHLRRSNAATGVMDLQPLDRDGPFYRNMLAALRQEGYAVDTYFCFGNWHVELAGRSFQQYFESVPSRIRNTIRRGRKKLDEGGDWDLRIEDGAAPDLELAIADFDQVYRRSWKVPEPYPAFVPNLIRMAANNGWLRLGIVRIGATPIAAQLWLVRNGRAAIYKLAYDEEYKRFSAGSVLTAEMMRHAIDIDQVVDIDYLTGDDSYKADWMSHRRERVGIVAFDPRTLQGLVSAARHFGAHWGRRLYLSLRRAAAATDKATGPSTHEISAQP